MKQKILVTLGTIMVVFAGVLGMGGETVMAACASNSNLFGFNSWYDGLTVDKNGSCVIDDTKFSGDSIAGSIWRIVLNVMKDLMLAVGWLAVAMVVYGGFQFITSQGDVGRAAKARKTLVAAAVGIVISIGAAVIVNTVLTVMGV